MLNGYKLRKPLRHHKLVITVPLQHSPKQCAVCALTSPDNGINLSEFVCQRCGHRDKADHNAAVVIAHRSITTLVSGDPLTKPSKRLFIFRTLGPERSQVTHGERRVRRRGAPGLAQQSQNHELAARFTANAGGGNSETPASAS